MLIMHFMKCLLCFIVLKLSYLVSGQRYNLTGSSTLAVLGKSFTWTCEMFLPPNQTVYGVIFYRNNTNAGILGYSESGTCVNQSTVPKYTYRCVSFSVYTVTIPEEHMTYDEQGLVWRCEFHITTNIPYTSQNVTLYIATDVHNVSLIPSDSPLILREGKPKIVMCEVNSNAFPAPSITWLLGSKAISSIDRTNTTFISITGNRTDNRKTLECSATNNNKQPKKANTTLSVEYPPTVKKMSAKTIKEKSNLLVTCTGLNGNPSSTTFNWTKDDNPGFKQSGAILELDNIQRNSSGTYRCTAENTYSNGEKGSDSQHIVVNILYPPLVNALSDRDIIEEGNLSVTCNATPGNPSSITYFWTKVDNSGLRQNGATLQLHKIKRSSSGTYRCTAENSYSNEEKGSDSQSMSVNVLFPPTVSALSRQDIKEGRNLSVTCTATKGNPDSTTFYWTKVDNSVFRQNETTLQLYNIQRNSSGTYRCTAENNYNTGEKGTDSQSMVVDVLYQPTIQHKPLQFVNESDTVKLTREISSNPSSNASWYDKIRLLKSEPSVMTTTLDIKNATCTDTKNFTLVVQNNVGNDTALVGLIVNCKPRSYKTNFTLGVTDTTGIDFSTIVIAYPEPSIELEHENGTVSDQMMKIINRNAVNNFTIQISQAVVNLSDFGVYHLKLRNSYGNFKVIINVIPQRKPNVPVSIEIVCEETRAKVQWKSSFNGGDPQLFTVIASSGQQSNNISDRGENVFHSTFVQHLQPSTMYVFYVSAQNSHGIISSEKKSCTTLAEKQAGKSQRFENDLVENESVDDDGLKDNILYVSADPKENEKHEAAVYAAVNKKNSMSNNNSNVYAEVKKNGMKGVKEGALYSDVKPKKGFFKKDGKVKKEKRQKRKQEVADVYENSDDIAMTANPDTVYSNTNQNNDSAKEQRGYKNKDGLLYVEVKFDTKTEERNPVIHGDDEKTDYATVEFPVPSSSHDRE
ncbi:hemicentin-1-like isoform X2 [Magallana gigas]|uniref:hemicentin-1-like isoform X2 n=1 Tax=Magallana gigas TaxID=29159 RepID=UPI00333F11DF